MSSKLELTCEMCLLYVAINVVRFDDGGTLSTSETFHTVTVLA